MFAVAPLLSANVFNAQSVQSSAFPADLNGRIVFSAGEEGGLEDEYDIYTIRADGTDVQKLVDTELIARSPQYSPDGTKIVYEQDIPGSRQVFIMNADGSNQTQLTSNARNNQPTFTPDGESILFSSNRGDGTYQIYAMGIDGSNQTALTAGGEDKYGPNVSPDGTQVAYYGQVVGAAGDEVFVMDIDGSNITRIVTNDDHDTEASWSPDGSKLIRSTLPDGTNNHYQVVTTNPDGSNETTLSSAIDHSDIYPFYSPDGKHIAYLSDNGDNGDSNLYIAKSDNFSDTTELLDITDINRVAFNAMGSWQPLTETPSSDDPNPTITVEDGEASIDIAGSYTDSYDGIDKSSLTITNEPSSGSTEISNGVVTYTQSSTAQSVWSKLAALMFPAVSAQASQDSFDYQICSESNSELCVTGTVTTVLGTSTDSSDSELAKTGMDQSLLTIIALVMVVGTISLYRLT